MSTTTYKIVVTVLALGISGIATILAMYMAVVFLIQYNYDYMFIAIMYTSTSLYSLYYNLGMFMYYYNDYNKLS